MPAVAVAMVTQVQVMCQRVVEQVLLRHHSPNDAAAREASRNACVSPSVVAVVRFTFMFRVAERANDVANLVFFIILLGVLSLFFMSFHPFLSLSLSPSLS